MTLLIRWCVSTKRANNYWKITESLLLVKYDYEYKRNGTCNLFVAVYPKGGKRFIKVTHTRTKEEFAYFMKDLREKHFAKAEYIQVVLDNLNTHFESSLVETLGKRATRRLMKKIQFN